MPDSTFLQRFLIEGVLPSNEICQGFGKTLKIRLSSIFSYLTLFFSKKMHFWEKIKVNAGTKVVLRWIDFIEFSIAVRIQYVFEKVGCSTFLPLLYKSFNLSFSKSPQILTVMSSLSN